MREDVGLRWGIFVPDEAVIVDEPDYFSYEGRNGIIVGWNRNEETFWRRGDDIEPKA